MSDLIIKSKSELEAMRAAGRVVGEVLGRMHDLVKPGVTTLDLDREAEKIIRDAGAVPSFLGYGTPPFPKSICASVNEEVVHGIPNARRRLKEGDIVSIDVGAYLHGYHGDAARTFPVGEVSDEAMELMRGTHDAFWAAYKVLETFREKNIHMRDVSAAIQQVADERGYGVFRELTGHGIGTEMHQGPEILNYKSLRRGPKITAGMALAIEPMFAATPNWHIKVAEDQWTIITQSGALASHYENTILVFEDHLEVSTMPAIEEPGEFYL